MRYMGLLGLLVLCMFVLSCDSQSPTQDNEAEMYTVFGVQYDGAERTCVVEVQSSNAKTGWRKVYESRGTAWEDSSCSKFQYYVLTHKDNAWDVFGTLRTCHENEEVVDTTHTYYRTIRDSSITLVHDIFRKHIQDGNFALSTGETSILVKVHPENDKDISLRMKGGIFSFHTNKGVGVRLQDISTGIDADPTMTRWVDLFIEDLSLAQAKKEPSIDLDRTHIKLNYRENLKQLTLGFWWNGVDHVVVQGIPSQVVNGKGERCKISSVTIGDDKYESNFIPPGYTDILVEEIGTAWANGFNYVSSNYDLTSYSESDSGIVMSCEGSTEYGNFRTVLTTVDEYYELEHKTSERSATMVYHQDGLSHFAMRTKELLLQAKNHIYKVPPMYEVTQLHYKPDEGICWMILTWDGGYSMKIMDGKENGTPCNGIPNKIVLTTPHHVMSIVGEEYMPAHIVEMTATALEDGTWRWGRMLIHGMDSDQAEVYANTIDRITTYHNMNEYLLELVPDDKVIGPWSNFKVVRDANPMPDGKPTVLVHLIVPLGSGSGMILGQIFQEAKVANLKYIQRQ